jgi:hypothetical protein
MKNTWIKNNAASARHARTQSFEDAIAFSSKGKPYKACAAKPTEITVIADVHSLSQPVS